MVCLLFFLVKKWCLDDILMRNIGNVKVAGMPKDIGASAAQYSTAVSIFYATYVTFETPLAMLMKKITPRNMLCGLCFVWSLTTIFTGFVTSVGGLYASRLVLGCCEAGLFPCLNLYISMVYRREEQAKRVSYLMCCAALSGAVGGLLAYGLLQMDGVAGKAGWRYLLIFDLRLLFQAHTIIPDGFTSSKEFSAQSSLYGSGSDYQMTLQMHTSSLQNKNG